MTQKSEGVYARTKRDLYARAKWGFVFILVLEVLLLGFLAGLVAYAGGGAALMRNAWGLGIFALILAARSGFMYQVLLVPLRPAAQSSCRAVPWSRCVLPFLRARLSSRCAQ